MNAPTLPPWTDDPQDLEDLLDQVISESVDMDWTPRTAARAILRELEAEGFRIIKIGEKQ